MILTFSQHLSIFWSECTLRTLNYTFWLTLIAPVNQQRVPCVSEAWEGLGRRKKDSFTKGKQRVFEFVNLMSDIGLKELIKEDARVTQYHPVSLI